MPQFGLPRAKETNPLIYHPPTSHGNSLCSACGLGSIVPQATGYRQVSPPAPRVPLPAERTQALTPTLQWHGTTALHQGKATGVLFWQDGSAHDRAAAT